MPQGGGWDRDALDSVADDPIAVGGEWALAGRRLRVLGQRQHLARSVYNRHIEELSAESDCPFPTSARVVECLDHAPAVVEFIRGGCECPVDELNLRGVDQ